MPWMREIKFPLTILSAQKIFFSSPLFFLSFFFKLLSSFFFVQKVFTQKNLQYISLIPN